MEPATGSRRPRVVKRLLVMASVLALFACGTPAGEVGSSAGTSTTLQTAVPTSFPSCEDVPFTRAADDHYSVTPLYIANEMPIDEVRSWAEFQPGFEELWIDRERNGWLTLGFTEGVADAQAAVSREFPGVGVVVVEVPFTLQELMDLHGRIREVLLEETEHIASSISVHKGVVEMNVAILTDEIRQVMEEHFVGEPICLDGGDASDYPEPAPQPLEGDGWRLLVHEPEVGWSYRTGIATDPESLRAMWAEIGLQNAPPEVDFEKEVVIWFGAVYGSSCPDLRLDDVIVDGDLVYPLIVLTEPRMTCTLDANPFTFVVAMDRSKLPRDGFAIQLGPEDPPPGAPEERTLVETDLTMPGSIAGPGQVGPDPLFPPPYEVKWGDYLEPGFHTGPYHFKVHCGIEWLGEFNGLGWRTGDPMPDRWREMTTRGETIEVTLLLHAAPDPKLEATAGGVAITYHPTRDPIPGCD